MAAARAAPWGEVFLMDPMELEPEDEGQGKPESARAKSNIRLERIDDVSWRIPKDARPGMRVDGIVYASEAMLEAIRSDQALEQVANVAHLPGIQGASLAMPDIHWGYGFCIGGVCATDPKEGGVISPGGVGYDINCGVRLISTDLLLEEAAPQLKTLMDQLFTHVPSGVGRGGRFKFTWPEMRKLMEDGPRALSPLGLVAPEDLEVTESGGRLGGADPELVSDRALERAGDQCGTLGSGNHFMEVQVVDEIVDEEAARVMGLRKGALTVMIHSGSRGLGHQVCDDALHAMRQAPRKYGIELPDRQLLCAPVDSPEGLAYLGQMRAAANFAWCNRQILTALVRQIFERVFGRSWEALGMHLVYDVAHNIAKFEQHKIGRKKKELCVHRKGATRAFPPGHPEIPERYRDIGQPVIIPGDMGRASWVLAGAEGSMNQTFGTTCHGAGRALSRKAAMRAATPQQVAKDMERRGVIARARTGRGLAEEQPLAYKEVDMVVDVVDRAGISRKVARLRPVGVIKG